VIIYVQANPAREAVRLVDDPTASLSASPWGCSDSCGQAQIRPSGWELTAQANPPSRSEPG